MSDSITIREKPRSEGSNCNASIHQISINIQEKQQQPQSRIAVVIPTRNNELTIGSIVLLARQHAGHVIVVDDSSHDRTVDIAQQAGAVVIPAGYYRRSGECHPDRLQARTRLLLYNCCVPRCHRKPPYTRYTTAYCTCTSR